MDCQKLKDSIEQLASLKQSVEQSFEKAIDGGMDNYKECRNLSNQCKEAEDSILSEFFDDLYAHNRDCFTGHVEETLEDFEGAKVKFYLHPLTLLPNGEVIISGYENGAWSYNPQAGSEAKPQAIEGVAGSEDGGSNCIVMPNGDVIMSNFTEETSGWICRSFICERRDDGTYAPSSRLADFETAEGNPTFVVSSTQISDSRFLISSLSIGDENEEIQHLLEYEVDSTGNYHVTRELETLERSSSRADSVMKSIPLPNGDLVLVGTMDTTCPTVVYRYTKDSNGNYQRAEKICPEDLETIQGFQTLPNGNILISYDSSTALYEYQAQDDGSYALVPQTTEEQLDFKGFDFSTALPNGDILLAKGNKTFFYRLQSDGGYKLEEGIANFPNMNITSILQLPSGDVLIAASPNDPKTHYSCSILEYRHSTDGSYSLSEPVVAVTTDPHDRQAATIEGMTALPDGDVMFCSNGTVGVYSMKPQLADLKRALGTIAAKKQ